MADAALATLGVVLALAGIFVAVLIVFLFGGAIIGWAWRRKMLRDMAKSEQPRSVHSYTPTNGPANPVPPQGGSGTIPAERLEEIMKRGREGVRSAFGLPPHKVGKS